MQASSYIEGKEKKGKENILQPMQARPAMQARPEAGAGIVLKAC